MKERWNQFLEFLDGIIEDIRGGADLIASFMSHSIVLCVHLVLWLSLLFPLLGAIGIGFVTYICICLNRVVAELIILRQQTTTNNRNQVKIYGILSRILVATNNAGNKRERKSK